MIRKLFLTGMPGTGKSTIIRECLSPVRDLAAGFVTARVLSSEGQKKGFTQFPADTAVGTEIISDAILPTQFMVFDEERKRSLRKELLFDMVKSALRESLKGCEEGRKKIIVLDEIGGLELEDDEVLRLLKQVLSSPWPCIGVIKCREHADRLLAGRSADNIQLRRYYALYEEIEKSSMCRILTLVTSCRDKMKTDVGQWLSSAGIISEES